MVGKGDKNGEGTHPRLFQALAVQWFRAKGTTPLGLVRRGSQGRGVKIERLRGRLGVTVETKESGDEGN